MAAKPANNLRWSLCGLLFAGMSIQSLDRVNLAAALPIISKTFHMSPALDGIVLSGFFWSYALCNIPAGYVVDRLRPRKAFGIIGLWWSAITLLTALSGGFVSLFALRSLLGAGQAGDFPAASATVGEWFPAAERGLASGIYSVGNDGGALIALPFSAFLLIHFGWPAVFVGCGIIGLLWTLAWWRLYHPPAAHPRVSAEERAYIEAGQPHSANQRHPGRRWIDLLAYRQTWGLIVGYFCYPYLYGFFLTWLPSYLVRARHFSLAEMGIYGSLPALFALAAGALGGKWTDALCARFGNVNIARKLPIGTGMALGAAALTGVAFASSPTAVIALLTLTAFSMRLAYGAIWALPVDVSPGNAYTASISGVMNAAGNLGGGVIAPIATGLLVSATHSFVAPLLLASAVALVGVGGFIFLLGPIEPLWRPDSPAVGERAASTVPAA